MNLVIVSFFRDSESRGQVQRFFQQVHDLKNASGFDIRVVAVEGDSRDKTPMAIIRHASMCGVPLELVTRAHGRRYFNSTEELERFEALSFVGNGGLEAVRQEDELVFYVESDLLWDAHTIIRCLAQVHPGMDIVSPLVFAGAAFYDVFAFRAGGQRFSPHPPYSHVLNGQNHPVEVDSVGSCLCMRGEVARNVRIPGNEVIIGFCRVAREQGYHVFVDPRERIQHP